MNLISVSMLGVHFNESLDNHIRRLCENSEITYNIFFDMIGDNPTVYSLNEKLAQVFPGELKIID